MTAMAHDLRPTVGLVHSPLVGPSSLAPLAAALRRAGWPVCMPSLEGIFDDAGTDRARVIARCARSLASVSGPLVLVGHGGAGPLLPAIGDQLSEVIGHVYVDAVLPGRGLAWVDEAPAELVRQLRDLVKGGRLPPWPTWFPEAQLPAMPDAPCVPWSWFTAPGVTGELPEHWGYVELSPAYPESVAEATASGVPCARVNAGHLATMTEPNDVADAVQQVIKSLISHM